MYGGRFQASAKQPKNYHGDGAAFQCVLAVLCSCVDIGTLCPNMSSLKTHNEQGQNVLYSKRMKKTGNFEPEQAEKDGTEMTPEQKFERFFIELVTSMYQENGLSHSDFGRAVFGEKSGVRIWGGVRSAKRERDITLAEVLKIAKALNVELPTLIFKAYERAKEKDILS